MMTSVRPPQRRPLTEEQSARLRGHLLSEIQGGLQPRIGDAVERTRELAVMRRVLGALSVAAVVVWVFFGLGPVDDSGSLPEFGQATAMAAVEIVENADSYEIVFVTLAEDVSDVEADLAELGLKISIDFVPASPSLESQLVAMASPAEGENLPRFEAGSDRATPSRLIVPSGFEGEASLTIGRPAEPGEEYVSAAVSAQAAGEALACVAIEGETARNALLLLNDVDVVIEWQPDLTGQRFSGSVPEEFLDWYVGATVPLAQQRVLVFLVPDDSGFEGSSPLVADC